MDEEVSTWALKATPTGNDDWSTRHLRAQLSTFRAKVDRARRLVAGALERHGGGWVSWSGGKDSTVCAAIAHDVAPGTPIVFFDADLDYPGHVDWMRDLAGRRGWNLDVIATDPPLIDWLIASGYWDHTVGDVKLPDGWPQTLNECCNLRPAAIARSRHGRLQIVGLRADESVKRSRGIAKWGVIRPIGNWIGLTPIAHWTRADVWAAHAHYDIERAPVYDRLTDLGCPEISQRVGVLVSADALGMGGRFTWLSRGWPQEWERLCTQLPMLRGMR